MDYIDTIIIATLMVLGWIIVHILNNKTNEKLFMNNIINNARKDILEKIRDYQDWLLNSYTGILGIDFNFVLHEMGLTVNWIEKQGNYNNLFYSDRRASRWIFCLEEYEILFPETAECRKELLDRHSKIQAYTFEFFKELPLGKMQPEEYEEKKSLLIKIKKDAEILLDQLSLMVDLQVYIQNKCLGKLTGYKIPEREPEDLSVPKIFQDESGCLKIVPAEVAKRS